MNDAFYQLEATVMSRTSVDINTYFVYKVLHKYMSYYEIWASISYFVVVVETHQTTFFLPA